MCLIGCLAFQTKFCLKHTDSFSVSAQISLCNLLHTHTSIKRQLWLRSDNPVSHTHCIFYVTSQKNQCTSMVILPFLFRVVAIINFQHFVSISSLAPPSGLLFYSHVQSYACSHLDALILQTSLNFCKKKRKRSGLGAGCM